ncbi:MAG TPA: RNA methyltransferase [Acidimicrobiales bacterium]|nr:RNA methyltransferase [Acidimicrobiales bacterium]
MQHLRQLIGRRPVREQEHTFVVEGTKALSEALDAGAHLHAVFAAPTAPTDVLERAMARGAVVHHTEPGVIERVAPTVSPQPLLAVAEQIDVPLDDLSGASLLLVAVDVSDPGNLGTVLRSAEAAGADGVVCCGSSVDVYNPKTVRAAAGAMFHLPLAIAGDTLGVLDRVGGWGMLRLGAVARGGTHHTDIDLRRRVALVIGNEAAGLPPAVLEAMDELVTIPMAGRAESLNVGVAAAVLCFEVARQRTAKEVPSGGS